MLARVRRPLLVPLAAVLGTACGSGGASPVVTAPASGFTAPPPASASPSPREVRIHLQQVASLDEPIAMAVRRGDPALYVAQKTGEVLAIRAGRVDRTPVLDVSGNLTTGGEEGLLGIAFSPDGGTLYASFTDRDANSNLMAYPFAAGRATTPGRLVLFVRQPGTNHNGGNVAFGPDGFLYVGFGDGGDEGDPNLVGQNLRTLLSKMLRIDPTPSGREPYRIPASNPFVGRTDARPEIWASGLRNPWRWSFDRRNGDLWIGDVGQGMWEEIDEQPAGSKGGENYGWSCFEGDHPFRACRPHGAVAPVYEYSHEDTGGCAVTGGYIYRGSAISGLEGAYLFGDYCVGRLMALVRAGGRLRVRDLHATVPQLDSFGQDASGELYALSLGGGVYRLAP
jgi:glucose/arabinose dehydrogenase